MRDKDPSASTLTSAPTAPTPARQMKIAPIFRHISHAAVLLAGQEVPEAAPMSTNAPLEAAARPTRSAPTLPDLSTATPASLALFETTETALTSTNAKAELIPAIEKLKAAAIRLDLSLALAAPDTDALAPSVLT